jgi:hypothetical protein
MYTVAGLQQRTEVNLSEYRELRLQRIFSQLPTAELHGYSVPKLNNPSPPAVTMKYAYLTMPGLRFSKFCLAEFCIIEYNAM